MAIWSELENKALDIISTIVAGLIVGAVAAVLAFLYIPQCFEEYNLVIVSYLALGVGIVAAIATIVGIIQRKRWRPPI
jgi:hypothetical protein